MYKYNVNVYSYNFMITFNVDCVVLKYLNHNKDTTLVIRSWPLRVVTKLLPGSDGVVRVVDIRCNNKEYRRSPNRLVLLFSSDQPNVPAREDVQALQKPGTD